MRWLPVLVAVMVMFLLGCAGGAQGTKRETRFLTSEGQASPSRESGTPGVVITQVAGAAIRLGAPRRFENLTVFPVFASAQVDPGPLRTLASALADGSAVVREVGADGPGPTEGPASRRGGGAFSPSMDPSPAASAEVGRLIIDNRGEVPIYVLAGTVVKGGKQDRQIGQDFVVPGKKTISVDAFCVEQGRWTAARDGADTGGQFRAAVGLATTKVRAAAQYKGDQTLVWREVAEVNKSHNKQALTGTLLATLDDDEVRARSSRLAEEAAAYLSSADAERVVGLAYAVGGEVRAVRWFAHRDVFALFRDMLLTSAALEAVTAQSDGETAPPAEMTQAEVTAFMAKIDEGGRAEEKKLDGNTNRYQFADDGAASEVFLPPPAASPAPAKSLGKDYTAY